LLSTVVFSASLYSEALHGFNRGARRRVAGENWRNWRAASLPSV